MDPAGGPDNIRLVASKDSDFCLTSVHHYLTAHAQEGPLSARFVAVVVQRSPLAAIVAAASDLSDPVDLVGVRVAVRAERPHGAEFLASLARLGVEGIEVVPMDTQEANLALGRGDIGAVVEFVDTLPLARRQAGVPVRAIPVGLDLYASGLVAGEHVDAATVWQMRAAVARALERQRAEPEAGVPELRRRYPEADVEDALEGWRLVEPHIFTGSPPGAMESGRWARTISFLCEARGLPHLSPETVYRPEFADVLQPG